MDTTMDGMDNMDSKVDILCSPFACSNMDSINHSVLGCSHPTCQGMFIKDTTLPSVSVTKP
eukprot:893574-Pelagomonas_calceolata.AAC.1